MLPFPARRENSRRLRHAVFPAKKGTGDYFPINEKRAQIVHDTIMEVLKDHPHVNNKK